MQQAATLPRFSKRNGRLGIAFVFHDSFLDPDAEGLYGVSDDDQEEHAIRYMPDEVTRALAGRMHYAAYRSQQAESPEEAADWKRRYFVLRDRIVVGNRKLAFRAARRWANRSFDDLIGECSIVLIRAVAVYNPWLGVRFSTYAFTCLVRALSRLSQRSSADRLSRALSLDDLGNLAPGRNDFDQPPSDQLQRLGEYLRDDHPLLSERERTVLVQRFQLHDLAAPRTLEAVGQELGISKERVRQVQAIAIGKLRRAMSRNLLAS